MVILKTNGAKKRDSQSTPSKSQVLITTYYTDSDRRVKRQVLDRLDLLRRVGRGEKICEKRPKGAKLYLFNTFSCRIASLKKKLTFEKLEECLGSARCWPGSPSVHFSLFSPLEKKGHTTSHQ